MDDRLLQALEFANYRHTLNNQLHKLKIKIEGLLIFAEAGGKFTVTRELICFVDYLVREGFEDSVLLDDNKTPTYISNTKEFLSKITARYNEVTNDYFRESQVIKKARDVKSILDIKGQ